MKSNENKKNDESYENSIIIKNAINNLKQMEAEKELTENEANELFDNTNIEYLKNNQQDNNKINNIIKKNLQYTEQKNQDIFWEKLLEIIDSMEKSDTKCEYPELPFGESLDDIDFLELFQKTVNYACYSQTNDILNYKKEQLQNINNYTNNIFLYPEILKNIKKNGLLAFVMAEAQDEIEDSMALINVKNCTLTPLIILKFDKEDAQIDLDKNELKEILTSNVLLKFYSNNLKNFTPQFDKKIKNDNDLKKYIISYIDNYNIYFCNLPSNIMAITIYSGDLYLKSEYLKEYFQNRMNHKKSPDDSIIIREKIVLNIKHEINHSLLREIDDEKKKNFFLKSQNSNSKKKILVFKDKYQKNKDYKYTADESGNCFDFAFYKGYYFINLFKNEANFFLDVKNMKNDIEYNDKFDKMMINSSKNKGALSSINKFKKKIDDFPHCFKSKILE